MFNQYFITNYDEMTFKEVKENDIESIREILKRFRKEDLIYDEDWESWLIWGEKPLDEWFFEEGYCIINPKELLRYMEEIIENEIMVE